MLAFWFSVHWVHSIACGGSCNKLWMMTFFLELSKSIFVDLHPAEKKPTVYYCLKEEWLFCPLNIDFSFSFVLAAWNSLLLTSIWKILDSFWDSSFGYRYMYASVLLSCIIYFNQTCMCIYIADTKGAPTLYLKVYDTGHRSY